MFFSLSVNSTTREHLPVHTLFSALRAAVRSMDVYHCLASAWPISHRFQIEKPQGASERNQMMVRLDMVDTVVSSGSVFAHTHTKPFELHFK